jgi:hypothetical protein
MSEYRLYCLDGGNRIHQAEWISAENDDDAIRQARELKRNAVTCEVWQGKRLVVTLRRQDLSD